MSEAGIKEIEPAAAQQVMQSDPAAIYLDVRSQREFAAGHVEGSYNIPLLEPDGQGQMSPNEDFLRVVQAVIPREAKLIVGCKSGGRSARAVQILTANGYGDAANLTGGLLGHYNWLGKLEAPGWVGSGLPVTTEDEGREYAALRAGMKSAE